MRNFLVILGLLALPGPVRAQFTFTANGSGITITGFNGIFRNVIIPAATNGLPVIAIGDFAFASDHQMTNVVIPGSIVSIGQYAFNDCRGLTSVSVPASVTNLGRIVFSYCTNLTNITVDSANPVFSSVGGVLFDKAQKTLIEFPCALGGNYVIPGSVTNIGFAALSSSAISSVAIHAGVIGMDTHAFNFCLNLTYISVNGANPVYSSLNGALFNKTQTELYQFPSALGGDYIVPKNVHYIGPDAFYGSGVTSVVFPKGIDTIEYEAFANCGGLTSVVIPAAITNLGLSAFYNCTNLTAAYFLGDAPMADGEDGDKADTFHFSPTTVFYMPGTTGWADIYGTVLTVLWNPQVSAPGFTSGQFGFNLTVPTNATIVVEACTNLQQPAWLPVATNVFAGNNQFIFHDAQSGNYPVRFYRLRSP